MPKLDRIDWLAAAAELDQRGYARLPGLLGARECTQLAGLYREEGLFRSFVDMGRHRYGRGDYRYFAYPLPPLVQQLRAALYPPLAGIANDWQERLGADQRFPPDLDELLSQCASAAQERPTPLLLRYAESGYNHLHQDRYGDIAFPLQVTILLSRSPLDAGAHGRAPDFGGGEFLLVEQRPRQQSRGEAVSLARGEAIVFPNAVRPVAGARGPVRATVRHGVSRIHYGHRMALGLIFHDAR